MTVAVIGSRSIVTAELEKYLPKGITSLVTGGASGVDSLAERYADANGIPKKVIYPNYEKYGKAATLIRNKQIVNSCDIVIAIWDGKSTGTRYTIEYARQVGKPFEVHIVE